MVNNTSTNIDLLIIACPPRIAKPLTDELTDQLEEQRSPARVVKYGVMDKGQDGFVILACPGGFPGAFLEDIRKDEEISGYIVLKGDELGATVAQRETQQ